MTQSDLTRDLSDPICGALSPRGKCARSIGHHGDHGTTDGYRWSAMNPDEPWLGERLGMPDPMTQSDPTLTRERLRAAVMLDAIRDLQYQRGRLAKVAVDDIERVMAELDAAFPTTPEPSLDVATATDLHGLASALHGARGHDWPVGQCGSCLDLADRTVAQDAALATATTRPRPRWTPPALSSPVFRRSPND